MGHWTRLKFQISITVIISLFAYPLYKDMDNAPTWIFGIVGFIFGDGLCDAIEYIKKVDK
jgi:hypothetical protein